MGMIFDYSDGNIIMPLGRDMGIDSDGNIHMRMGENMAMNMDSGDIHLTSPWKNHDKTQYLPPIHANDDFLRTDDSDNDDDDIFGPGTFFQGLW